MRDMAVEVSLCERVGAEPTQCEWMEAVYCVYERFCRSFALEGEQGLGGRLIFAGELRAQREDAASDALVAAANIASAATLAAAPDAVAQRRVMRDALVDFVVNSLDEALRILKNEVRQRRAVSVAVAIPAEQLAEEMRERGVQPERFVASAEIDSDFPASVFVAWRRESCCSRAKSVEETAAMELASDPIRQRWLRLAPRYLGRAAHRVMGVGLSGAEIAAWRERVASARGVGECVETTVERR